MDLFQEFFDWLRISLVNGILDRYENMFKSINDRVGTIAIDVGQTPQGWNQPVFNMIKDLSNNAIIPIAGMIITFVLCYELTQMIIEKNNMHEFDVFNIYKWILKTFCAVWILTHTFDIVMGVFELAQFVVNISSTRIQGNLIANTHVALQELADMLSAMNQLELIGVYMEMFVLDMCLEIMSLFIFIIIFGRMLEIYLTVSIAPIPLSTMANREWGQIGNNYIKSLFALAFQGFLIMVCVAIYSVLVQDFEGAGSIHATIWMTAGYTALLCFALLKSGSLSKSLFAAH